MRKQEIAKRVWEIDQELKGLEDERKELREELEGRMDAGEIVPFETELGPYRAKKCETEVKILKSAMLIENIVGRPAFFDSITVSVGKLEAAIKKHLTALDPVEAMAACTAAVEKKAVLKILKGRE